jgi:hypothetical protein
MQPIRHVSFCIVTDPSKMAVDVVSSGEVAGEDRRATWRANATGDGKTMEIGTLSSQTIDVRRFYVRMPVTTQIAPPPIIREDEKDVGRRCRFRMGCKRDMDQ